VPKSTDEVIRLPAQTMAADQGESKTSILPMGSLFEVLMFLFFEILVLDMRERLGISSGSMRSKHTNLE
jgi:6-phospho-3-hexuloisomerase